MQCPACNMENPPQARFCMGCAAPLARRCSACGTALPESARFCMECAQPVAGSGSGHDTRQSPGISPDPPPQTYTPRHLAEKILAGREALAGERKQVTVLFADVVGSTELIRGRDAEEAQRLLDGVVRVMMDAVHRYEGTVSRLMGDGLMAMFGAPVAHEDHAVRACYAALAMLEAARRHARTISPESGAQRRHPGRAERRRGRGSDDQRRPAHGLHGDGRDRPPGRPDGAGRRSRHRHADRRDAGAGGGVRPGAVARAGAGQGPGRADRGLPARRRRAGPDQAPGGSLARADPLRRAAGRAGGAAPRARAGG